MNNNNNNNNNVDSIQYVRLLKEQVLSPKLTSVAGTFAT
jgi:hypothetical protein